MMKIKKACVRCTNTIDNTSVVGEGYDHTSCYEYISNVYGYYPRVEMDKYRCEEGFLLEDNTFIDRHKAFSVAKECNQLLPEYKHYTDVLHQGLKSYMIDWRS